MHQLYSGSTFQLKYTCITLQSSPYTQTKFLLMKGRHLITLDLCTIVNGQLGEKLLVSLSKGETVILY